MSTYIKYLVEAFDFNSVKKQNKSANIVDVMYNYIKPILLKIDNREVITKNDYDILKDFTAIYKVFNKNELQLLIMYFIELIGNDCDLNWIDVSNITDMSGLFKKSRFIGDISKWNVSNVTKMNYMFSGALFNGDISLWDVSNVSNMYAMFLTADFNNDIGNWDVSNVTDMRYMFQYSEFNKDISNWNISNTEKMSYMFYGSKFNKDISNWTINNGTDVTYMFRTCPIKSIYKPKFND